MGAVVSTAGTLFTAGCQTLTFCVTCADCCSRLDGSQSLSLQVVNGIYVILIGIFMTLGFFLRNLGDKFNVNLHSWKIHCSDNAGNDEHNIFCQGDAAVYRLSFVLSVFFALMIILSQISAKFHAGFWGIKFFGLFILSLAAFFIPNGFFDDHGFANAARFGSVFFLGLQILLLIDFAYDWSARWMEEAFPDDGSDHNKKFIFAILGVSFLLYCSVFVGIPILFSKSPENVAFSSVVLASIIILSAATFSRHLLTGELELRGQILPAAIISAYSMYLLWSALDSSAESEAKSDHSGLKFIVGTVFATLSLMYSALSTSNSLGKIVDAEVEAQEPLLTVENEEESEAGEKSGLAWFHLLMLSASMYMSMLLTNWGVNEFNAEESEQNGVNSMNFWVKIVSQWVIVVLYLWTLVAPVFLPDRDFD